MRAPSPRQMPGRLATRAALVLGTVLAMSTLLAAGQSASPSREQSPALASGPPFWLPVASMHNARSLFGSVRFQYAGSGGCVCWGILIR